MKKSCWNCLFEYMCDWSEAGDKSACQKWKGDESEDGKTDFVQHGDGSGDFGR